MRDTLKKKIAKLQNDFNEAIQKPIPLSEAIEAAEELGSHVDAVLDGLRDDRDPSPINDAGGINPRDAVTMPLPKVRTAK